MSDTLFFTTQEAHLSALQDRTVKFVAEGGKEIGCFDFGQSPVTFTGDADASAQMFIDCVIRMWPENQQKEIK